MTYELTILCQYSTMIEWFLRLERENTVEKLTNNLFLSIYSPIVVITIDDNN